MLPHTYGDTYVFLSQLIYKKHTTTAATTTTTTTTRKTKSQDYLLYDYMGMIL
jgi:hypothetical protein